MELKTKISFKGIISISLLYLFILSIIPGIWILKIFIVLVTAIVLLGISLQLIANKEGIVFRYPYNPLTNDYKFLWKDLYLIEYIKKDGIIEGRGVTDFFNIEYKDVGKEIRKKKKFQLKLTQQELDVLKKLCEENLVAFNIQEAFLR